MYQQARTFLSSDPEILLIATEELAIEKSIDLSYAEAEQQFIADLNRRFAIYELNTFS